MPDRRSSAFIGGQKNALNEFFRRAGLSVGASIPPGTRGSAIALVHRHPAKESEVSQHLAGADDNRRQRVLGDGDGKTGFAADPGVQVLEKGSAAGQDD